MLRQTSLHHWVTQTSKSKPSRPFCVPIEMFSILDLSSRSSFEKTGLLRVKPCHESGIAFRASSTEIPIGRTRNADLRSACDSLESYSLCLEQDQSATPLDSQHLSSDQVYCYFKSEQGTKAHQVKIRYETKCFALLEVIHEAKPYTASVTFLIFWT